MPLAKLLLTLRRTLQRSRWLQVAALGAFWALGEAFARRLALPVPGGILGLFAVLGLLASGWIQPSLVRRGARWLMAEMLLFFVPAVMALLDHRELVGLLGLKLLAVVLLGTLCVMCTTALTIETCFRWSMRHEPR